MKKGRPKGSLQKNKDISKYWLPDGVILSDNNPNIYNKESKLEFIDGIYGRFISSFKAIQKANGSTHPEALKARRKAKFKAKYGVENMSQVKSFREKAKQTMLSKYGVKNALENKDLLEKSKATLLKNYGVEHPMYSDIIVEKQQNTVFNRYGETNVMKIKKVKEKLKTTFIKKFGVDNPSKSPEIRKKIIKATVNNHTSKGELEVKRYIESLGIKCEKGYIGGTNPKELDILIKSLNIAIEFNGAYWHSEANNIDRNYHYDKYKACADKGIKLIQIFDFEWENRKKQVKGFLKAIVGKNEIKLNARQCEFRDVPKKDAKLFLDKYHIMGTCTFTRAYGLYYKNELVSLMTVSKHHRGTGEKVVSRFCNKYNTTVRGGLSRLSSNVTLIEERMSTWIDLRISNGENWIKNGWRILNQSGPDYFYFDTKNHIIVKKQARMKSVVKTPDNVTESEHAKIDGLYRIWDCGKLKLVYTG